MYNVLCSDVSREDDLNSVFTSCVCVYLLKNYKFWHCSKELFTLPLNVRNTEQGKWAMNNSSSVVDSSRIQDTTC